jgi:hypothetical protein
MSFISVMIPSRKRVVGLDYTCKRLWETASSFDFEILVKLDHDDVDSISAIPTFEKTYPNIRFIVSSRERGYSSLDEHFYASLEREAVSPWVWIAGDDMDVLGDWFGQLKKVPMKGFIVQPEMSKLNTSAYHRAHAQAFPIFPKFCWKEYVNEFPRPFDTAGDAMLKKHGWKTWFLDGVTFIHNEATPDELEKHRKT